MKKILILLIFISGSALAQKLPDDGFDKIRIAAPDKTIQAELKVVDNAPEMETDRLYYWYSGNSIHSTQGGYSGRLLNGKYSEYYINKNLKELGGYKKGLKDGIWRNWNEDGILLQSYTWQKGIKSGEFNVFDEHGKLKQSGSYRHNLLNGQVKTYAENNTVTILTYQDGVMINHPSSSFWNKINILKKKDKQAKAKTPSVK